MDDPYLYAGARATILLHERHMREFLATWKRARDAELPLPATDDPSYASLATLLRHVLGAGRGYMVWICEVLALPDPDIRPAPEPDAIDAEADAYLEHLLTRWREPLRGVDPERFDRPEYESRWGVKYCIDAMLEHAVMHPIRHAFQLEELLQQCG